MLRVVFLALFLAVSPAAAQYVVPLATADGRVGCTQGMTGIGHPQHWEAVKDGDAPAGWALAEITGDPTDLRFPFCIDTQAVVRDFDATLRLKIVAGAREQAGGLMFRAQNATDYVVARASALDGTVKLYRVLDGRRTQLASRDAGVKAATWIALRVLAVKARIEVWLDRAPVLKFDDHSSLQAGTMGVWTQADSLVHFGSMLVGPPPPAP
jgi:hypothetical protein